MTFAGNFFTEEMERQSHYNVVQIVVKTMTREPQGKVQNHGRNEWLHRLSMLYVNVKMDIFFVICPGIQWLLPFYMYKHG